MTGVKVERDDAIMAVNSLASRASAVRLLRVVWRALLDGAAMYGAAIHGYSNTEDFRSDIARLTDNECASGSGYRSAPPRGSETGWPRGKSRYWNAQP